MHIRALDGTMALIIHSQLMISILGDERASDGHKLQVFPAADVSNTTQNFTFLISCEDDAMAFISKAEEKVLR